MTGDTFCSHATTMSNIPMPENLLKHIENLFIVLLQEIEAYSKLSKASPAPVKQLITKFNNNPLIVLLTATPLAQKGPHSQHNHASELANIKTTLQQLSKAIDSLTKASNPPIQSSQALQGCHSPPNPPIFYLAIARARPQNARIILDLA